MGFPQSGFKVRTIKQETAYAAQGPDEIVHPGAMVSVFIDPLAVKLSVTVANTEADVIDDYKVKAYTLVKGMVHKMLIGNFNQIWIFGDEGCEVKAVTGEISVFQYAEPDMEEISEL